jgi:hypothetical protein
VLARLAADRETQMAITEKLLLLPVKWGREAAWSYMKSAYELFGRQKQAPVQ